jgi:hypothetical protein
MKMIAEHEEVWVAALDDKSEELADKLTALANAGADLDFIIQRRCHEQPGRTVVFVTPLRSHREVEVAREEGFSVSCHLHSVRVEGENEPGVAAKVTHRLAQAGLKLRGFSVAVIGERYVAHLAFDTVDAAHRAVALCSSWSHAVEADPEPLLAN